MGLSSIVDTQGREIDFGYTYNVGGDVYQLTTITAPGGSGCPSGTCTYHYAYHTDYTLASFTDPTGAVTQFTYSGAGKLASITDPRGNTSSFTWNAVTGGYQVASITDATSKTTTFTYGDTSGGFCSTRGSTDITDPGNSSPTRYCADGGLRVTAERAPDGSTSTTDYTQTNGGSGCTDASGYGISVFALPCSATDADGNTTTYTYDPAIPADTTAAVDPTGATTSITYDTADNLPYYPKTITSPPDDDGNYIVTTFAYDTSNAAGNLASTTIATYDSSNALVSSTVDRQLKHDSFGSQTASTNGKGYTTVAGYDGAHQLTCSQTGLTAGTGTAIVCGVGNDSTKAYYCPLEQTCPTTTYTYDTQGNQVTVTGPDLHTTVSTYDAKRELTCSQSGLTTGSGNGLPACPAGTAATQPFYCPSGQTCPTTTYLYDRNGNQTAVVGPNGYATVSAFDGKNELVCSESGLAVGTGSGTPACPAGTSSGGVFYCPSGQTCPTTRYVYVNGNQVAFTDPNDHVTVSVYDSKGEVTCTQSGLTTGTGSGTPTCPAGTVSTNAFYCDSGKTCPISRYFYDPAGNQLAVTDPMEHTTTYAYNGNGAVTCVQTGLTEVDSSAPIRCGAGPATRRFDCTSGQCPATTYRYDAKGNKTSITDGNGNTTATHYDASSRVNCSQTGLSTGSLTGKTTCDDNSSGHRFYCPAGDTCPATHYVYDANGNQVAQTDGEKHTSVSAFDNNDQLTCSQSGLSNGTAGATVACGTNTSSNRFYCLSGDTCPTSRFVYDDAGNQAGVTDAEGHTSVSAFDNNGQLTCSQSGLSNGTAGATVACGTNTSSNRFYCLSGDTCPTSRFVYDDAGNQVGVTDAEGHTSVSAFDNNGQLACSQTGLSNGTAGATVACGTNTSSNRFYCLSGDTCATSRFVYDDAGNQVGVTDAEGHTSVSAFDNNGQLACSQSGLSNGTAGATVACGTNTSSNRFYCLSGDTCPTSRFVYDDAGNQVGVTDAEGHTSVSGFDKNNQLTCSQSGLSNGTAGATVACGTNTSSNRFYCLSGDTCPTSRFVYDDAGNQVGVTDAEGHTSVSGFDKNNQLTCSQSGLSNGTAGATVACGTNTSSNRFYCLSGDTCATSRFVYDDAGNQVAVTDPDGHVTQSLFDKNNQLTCSETGLSAGSGSTVSCQAGTSSTTYRFYCPSGSTCPSTQYAYDAVGNQVAVTDPDGHVTQSLFDKNNQLTCSETGLSAGSGSTVSCQAGTSSTTYRFYCPSGSTCPSTQYAYDAVGNQVAVTDPDGHVTQSLFDKNNQLTCSETGLSAGSGSTVSCQAGTSSTTYRFYCPSGSTCPSTQFAYDAAGNQVAVTDPEGHTSVSGFDKNNQLTCSETGLSAGSGSTVSCQAGTSSTTYRFYRPSGSTCPSTQFAYDAVGNQVAVTDPEGHTSVSGFDKNSQSTCSQSGLSTGTPSGPLVCGAGTDSSKRFYCPPTKTCPTTTYAYDANGNQTVTTEPSTDTVTNAYDNNDLLTAKTYSDSTPDVSYTYNPSGSRHSMTDGAGTNTYLYNNVGQLTSSTRGSDTFSYGYAAAGNITSRGYPNGTTTSYAYTNNEALSTATSGGNTTTYTYYPAGETHTRTLPNGYVETSTYGNTGARTEIQNAKSGTTLSDYAYTFDAAGNPLTVVQTGAVTSTTRYHYNNNGQLDDACYQATTCSETSGSSDPYIHYTYDGNGNRLTETRPSGTTTSSYNNLDELTSAGSTTYTYDANGNEASAGSQTFTYNAANQLTATTTSGTTTAYTYDGDGNQLSTSTGSATTSELWDTNGGLPQLALERDASNTVLRSYIYGNERVSMNSSGSAHYYLYDTQGSVANVTAAPGTTDWTYSYDPFGATRTQTHNDPTAPANPMQYSGEMLDTTSGLYNLRARQYDATTGRFLSQDPLANADQTAGTYIYANDNPNIYNDPAGTCYRQFGPGNVGKEAEFDNDNVLNPYRRKLCQKVNENVSTCLGKVQRSKHYIPSAAGQKCWAQISRNMGPNAIWLWAPDMLPNMPLGDFVKTLGMDMRAVGAGLAHDPIAIGRYAWHNPQNIASGRFLIDLGKYAADNPVDALLTVASFLPGGALGKVGKLTIDAARALKIGVGGARALDSAYHVGLPLWKILRTACGVPNSFPGGTPVAMADGSKEPIRDVRVGDKVLATDPVTGETSARPVTALIRHHERRTMVKLGLSDGSTITATDLHPFWDASTSTFTDAIDLHIGDQLLTDDGRYLTVTSMHSHVRELKTYNLTIAGVHTYYAGTTPVLVHNANLDCAASAANAARLAAQLTREEAEAIFTASGGLKKSVIDDSVRLIGGDKLSASVAADLRKEGGSISDWGKYTTRNFKSPEGSFQVHFYWNPKLRRAFYGRDFKKIFAGRPR